MRGRREGYREVDLRTVSLRKAVMSLLRCGGDEKGKNGKTRISERANVVYIGMIVWIKEEFMLEVERVKEIFNG